MKQSNPIHPPAFSGNSRNDCRKLMTFICPKASISMQVGQLHKLAARQPCQPRCQQGPGISRLFIPGRSKSPVDLVGADEQWQNHCRHSPAELEGLQNVAFEEACLAPECRYSVVDQKCNADSGCAAAKVGRNRNCKRQVAPHRTSSPERASSSASCCKADCFSSASLMICWIAWSASDGLSLSTSPSSLL